MRKKMWKLMIAMLVFALLVGTVPTLAADAPAEAALEVELPDLEIEGLISGLGELGEQAEPAEEETEEEEAPSGGLDIFGGIGSISSGINAAQGFSQSDGGLVALDDFGISIQTPGYVSIHQMDDGFVYVFPLYDLSVPYVMLSGFVGRYDQVNGFIDQFTQGLDEAYQNLLVIEPESTVKLGNHTFTRIGYEYTDRNVTVESTYLFCVLDGNTYVFASLSADDYGYQLPSGYLERIAGGFALLAGGYSDYPYHVSGAGSSLYPGEETANTTARNTSSTAKSSSKSSEIRLVDYEDRWVSMKIPAGWQVYEGGTVETFAIRVVDPNDNRNQIFRYVQQNYAETEQSARNYKMYGSDMPYLQNPTVEGVFQMQNIYASTMKNGLFAQAYAFYEFPSISEFKVIKAYDTGAETSYMNMDPKVLWASFNNGNTVNGGECEGLFSAEITNLLRASGAELKSYGIPEDPNMYNQIGIYTSYFTSGITAAKGEFDDYGQILMECLNSMQYSKEFTDLYVQTSNDGTQAALDIGRTLSQISSNYVDAWSEIIRG